MSGSLGVEWWWWWCIRTQKGKQDGLDNVAEAAPGENGRWS